MTVVRGFEERWLVFRDWFVSGVEGCGGYKFFGLKGLFFWEGRSVICILVLYRRVEVFLMFRWVSCGLR